MDHIIICNLESQVISPNPSFIPTGGNETLTCQHPLYPDGTVRWIQGGLKSLNDVFLDEPRLVMSGSNLSISSFHASELAGEYVCIANPPEDSTHTVVSCPAKVKHACKFQSHSYRIQVWFIHNTHYFSELCYNCCGV